MTRLAALLALLTLLATAASAQTGPATTVGPSPLQAGLGEMSFESASPAGPVQRLRDYTACRTKRGYPVNTRTPSERELRACRSQLRQDAIVDTHVAIRVVFDEPDWPAAICIVDHEGGRWNRVAPMGAAGEITSWQWHPGWWKPGHTFNGGAPVLDEQRLRESATYATRAARRLWERSGRTFRVHWVNTSRKCGL
ncbi:MAG: hypothetical protein ACKVWR_21995 [Acidimicrobiales bacterium]